MVECVNVHAPNFEEVEGHIGLGLSVEFGFGSVRRVSRVECVSYA